MGTLGERGLTDAELALVAGLTDAHPLYGWQRRLLKGWLGGQKWDAIDVPTGLGKTTVITLWLIARAAGADLPGRLVRRGGDARSGSRTNGFSG
jgi:hypothetical protein